MRTTQFYRGLPDPEIKRLENKFDEPILEVGEDFLGYMKNRRRVGSHRYGKGLSFFDPANDKHTGQYLKKMLDKLDNYHKTHNLEMLVDAAVYAWLEFTDPQYNDAYYEAEDQGKEDG